MASSSAGAAFWDRIAERYAARPLADEAAYETTLARVRAHLKPADMVLELGCGTGTTALRLADAAAGITATDLAPAMIAIARERAAGAAPGNVTFAVAGLAEACTGPPHDVVMAFNLLHLVEDLDAALAAIHGAVAPGGLFLSKTPCLAARDISARYRIVLALALPVMQALGRAPALARVSVADLERRIAAAGFEIVETGTYPIMPPARFIVARKADGAESKGGTQ